MVKKDNIDTINTSLFFFIVVAGFLLLDLGFASTILNDTYMTVFVTNTQPVVQFANITPDPAYPGQTLTALANITDVNLDTITATIIYYNTTDGAESGTISLSYDGTWYTNNTFTLPATAAPGTWYINITITDGITTIVNKTTFTVNAAMNTRLQNTPVDFGNQTVGTVAARAENTTAVAGVYKGDAIRGFPLILNNTGNVLSNYSINGTNLIGQSDGSKVIAVGNVTWNTTDTGTGTRDGKTALATGSPATIQDGVSAGSAQNVYFWIDIPVGVTQQEYRGNITIQTIG